MNLLVVSGNLDRASFRQRIGIYLESLRKKGIECEVAEMPPAYLERSRLFKSGADFDAVLLHKKCLNLCDSLHLKKYSRKVIYDLDDAVMYSPHRPASDRTSHFKLFRRIAKLADMIIAGNAYLAEHAHRFNSNVKILPTGLDVSAYKMKVARRNDGSVRLVWIGSQSTLKYLAEITPALEEIGSRFDNVILRIICDKFPSLENLPVEERLWSLETQAADLATSDIGLAPLPDNRFTRGKCGFKILQYAAAGLPAITSPVGVNSSYVQDGITGLFTTDHRAWVESLERLIENCQLRSNMGLAAKEWVAQFDVTVLAEKLCDIICNCVKQSSPRPASRPKAETIKPVPTVSICIPTYNRRDYLKETLDSILAQTYKDYEIVIVDDGSTDGTEDMIENLGCPIRYCWQENMGDAAARNRLIELAQGRYISFIDSDDILLPDAIERMVDVIKAEGDDVVVYGSYFRIDQDGKISGRSRRKLYTGNVTKYLFQDIFVHCCGSMLPKKLLDGAATFDPSLKVCSDYDLWLRLSTKHRFVALAEPTFKRRRHTGNLSTSSFENCLAQFQVLKRFYYEKGGREIVPPKIAERVLGRQAYRAGRCAFKEGLRKEACQLLKQSFVRRPGLRSLINWARAAVAKRVMPMQLYSKRQSNP
jgi:glycosyltransferase involved in cell wall biosynthesis